MSALVGSWANASPVRGEPPMPLPAQAAMPPSAAAMAAPGAAMLGFGERRGWAARSSSHWRCASSLPAGTNHSGVGAGAGTHRHPARASYAVSSQTCRPSSAGPWR
eukprot:scaffold15318_cov125-Isochrysis_galbana.AAC.5